MKIAVMGSGIAGLSAAWLLSTRHEVVLFEKDRRFGGHCNTVETAHGHAVDTGFIVYNETNYPQLTKMFTHLGVATQPGDMSFGVSLRDGAYEYAGDSFGTLFLQPRNRVSVRHWHMLVDILRFNHMTKTLLRLEEAPDVTLSAFLRQHRFQRAIASRYLLPMAGAIWSCSPRQAGEFPYPEFARFFDSHGLLNAVQRPQWRTVTGGSRRYVARLLKEFRGEARAGCPVLALTRDDHGVTVASTAGQERFDAVVCAARGDQTLRALTDAHGAERKVLGAFRGVGNRTVLHGDESLMPRRRRAWSSWNYLSATDDVHDRPVSVTYWMNRLQALESAPPYFVTLNPEREPRAGSVLYETVYEHPRFDAGAMAAQRGIPGLQGRRRTWFCGAWCGYGFHEDGLTAALQVCADLSVRAPWLDSAAAPGDWRAAA